MKGGEAPKVKILGMDYNIIVLLHVYRDTTEKIKPCKVF